MVFLSHLSAAPQQGELVVNELFFESLGHTVGFVFDFPRAIKTSSNLTEGSDPSFQYIRSLLRMSAKISFESIVSYM